MKAPLSWLKEFVPLPSGAEEVAHRLTFAGLEVEGVSEVEGEKVLEINVTANRGDCLSILGLTRELSALYGLKLKRFESRKVTPARRDPSLKQAVRVMKPASCARYDLAVIEGVRIGPSPDWLAGRLSQVGIRPINNVVDVTNYVLMETGHPLHAFDRAKIRGGKIVVRAARNQERILTLDGAEQELVPDDLVIADAEGPIALAGVMGGKESEVDEGTTTVALECAFFAPAGIRRTARRLGIQTESSYRFERRVDPEGIPAALQRAVGLIIETAGGSLVGPVVDLRKGSRSRIGVSFRPSEVETILGGAWKEAEIQKTLTRLSFGIRKQGKNRWTVSVPSFRGDVERPIDLIEEVARVNGFDRIQARFPALTAPPLPLDRSQRLEKEARRLLASIGLREVVHFSFVSPEEMEGFGGGLAIRNPLGREYSLMRSSLLPSLLKTAAYHHNHRILDVRTFELRRSFLGGPGGVRERKVLTVLLTGRRLFSHWSSRDEETDFFDLKGILERLLDLLGLETGDFETADVPFLHPQKQAFLKVADEKLGVLGEIHPSLLSRFELKKTALVFEIGWDGLVAASRRAVRGFQGYGRYPEVERDLALVLDDGIPAGRVQALLHGIDPSIQEVAVFDLYRGGQIPQGKKSLAFSVRIGRKDRTMTEEEVNEIFNRAVNGVKINFQAEVR